MSFFIYSLLRHTESGPLRPGDPARAEGEPADTQPGHEGGHMRLHREQPVGGGVLMPVRPMNSVVVRGCHASWKPGI